MYRLEQSRSQYVLTRALQVYPEVLPDEDTTTGDFATDTDSAQQRTDDAVDEGRNISIRKHEPTDESAGTAKDSHGIRKGKRHYGPATGDDGRRD